MTPLVVLLSLTLLRQAAPALPPGPPFGMEPGQAYVGQPCDSVSPEAATQAGLGCWAGTLAAVTMPAAPTHTVTVSFNVPTTPAVFYAILPTACPLGRWIALTSIDGAEGLVVQDTPNVPVAAAKPRHASPRSLFLRSALH